MTIENNTIQTNSQVLMHFSILLEDGSAAESTKVHNKPAKFVMGDGSLTPNFEQCLVGLAQGAKKAFTLQPSDAFGLSNPDNIYHLDRSKFSPDTPAEVGAIIAFSNPDGSEIPGIVRDVVGQSVTVDFNHPLAGQVVTFDVEILEINQPA